MAAACSSTSGVGGAGWGWVGAGLCSRQWRAAIVMALHG